MCVVVSRLLHFACLCMCGVCYAFAPPYKEHQTILITYTYAIHMLYICCTYAIPNCVHTFETLTTKSSVLSSARDIKTVHRERQHTQKKNERIHTVRICKSPVCSYCSVHCVRMSIAKRDVCWRGWGRPSVDSHRTRTHNESRLTAPHTQT